jgi:hypothetical protein
MQATRADRAEPRRDDDLDPCVRGVHDTPRRHRVARVSVPVVRDQLLCADRQRKLDRLARVHVAHDALRFTLDASPVDREQGDLDTEPREGVRDVVGHDGVPSHVDGRAPSERIPDETSASAE